MEWLFDGIGTELIGTVIGIVLGGIGGYQIGLRKVTIEQTQTAGDNSTQNQYGIEGDSIGKSTLELIDIEQHQSAGDNANQYQGGIRNEYKRD